MSGAAVPLPASDAGWQVAMDLLAHAPKNRIPEGHVAEAMGSRTAALRRLTDTAGVLPSDADRIRQGTDLARGQL